MSRCVVEVEIFRVRNYLDEVEFSALASPTSVHYLADLSDAEVAQVRRVVCSVGPVVQVIDEVWSSLRQPGLLNAIRRCLMRRLVLLQLQSARWRLDAVRVGHHVRWSAPGVEL